ncbi:YdgH/BhsA/McbA-like domain containing protein [Erwinia tasmaniensis]|uniref:YdgH/BhsA/McbA-like domain-containing protein n=1 Tax=Erwinia tasmaniensis (strain DSM 17950 / CFBP 7177 / CIP 109463 / NCPPB 4357 / Et1/99) TaxID=465817 RepID=B2VCJ9_ERWT9|nr:YdgH/BhsA/McbA-like domain containing protein [Erwinia tasmaniensis]CAO98419.1 hypothetical protein ETA_33730 [Erwinia tasmaniensis Et1/99]
MKTIKNIAAVLVLSTVSFTSFAQSVTATGTTLDSAEAKIAAQAQQAGASYKITEANTNNVVHMTAELIK